MANHYIPNSAAIPNILFDYWMPKLNGSSFKILMAIARKTYGWRKEFDAISVKQLENMTGLARRGIFTHLEELVELGVVIKIKSKTTDGDDAPNQYTINIDCQEGEVQNSDGGGAKFTPPVVQNLHQGVVQNLHPQNTIYTKPNITREEQAQAPAISSVSSHRKKIKEEKREVFQRVFLSPSQEEALIKKVGSPEMVQKCYQKLSDWKIGRGISGGKDDYLAICKWVIDAVKEDKILVSENIKNPDANVQERISKNYKIADEATAKLSSEFKERVFCATTPNSFQIVNLAKDIKKEYKYSDYEPSDFVKIIFNGLEQSFPKARDILIPKKQNSSVQNLISGLKDQFQMATKLGAV